MSYHDYNQPCCASNAKVSQDIHWAIDQLLAGNKICLRDGDHNFYYELRSTSIVRVSVLDGSSSTRGIAGEYLSAQFISYNPVKYYNFYNAIGMVLSGKKMRRQVWDTKECIYRNNQDIFKYAQHFENGGWVGYRHQPYSPSCADCTDPNWYEVV